MGSIWLIMSNNCGTTIVHLFVNKLIFFLTRLAQIFESLHLRYEVHLTSVFFQKIRLHQYSFFLSFYVTTGFAVVIVMLVTTLIMILIMLLV